MSHTYRRIVLASRPSGLPTAENFEIQRVPIPDLGEGQFLVRNDYLGLAPASRIRMTDGDSIAMYEAPTPIGDVIYGQSIGRVIESRNPDHPVGELVSLTAGGWQEISVSDGSLTYRIDETTEPTHWLGALGVSGLTAYAGLLAVGELKPSDLVVVSAAAGGVGAMAAQIAKARGCRVVGIAGGPDKCRFLRDDLGLHAAVDHRAADFAAVLREATDDGVDVYFDNVGGMVQAEVLGLMATFGRIVVCGMIAEYNDLGNSVGPSWLPILTKRLTVRGFLMRDHICLRDDFIRDVSGWIRNGDIVVREDIVEGLEHTPDAFIRMLSGRNFGKTIVKL